MRWLVTGGAGYIGSVVAAQLIEAGDEVTVLDDLSTGRLEAVPPSADFKLASIFDASQLLEGGFDGVFHFAGRSIVSDAWAFSQSVPAVGRAT